MPMAPKSLKAAGFVTPKLAPYRCFSPACKKRMAENHMYFRSIHYLHSPLEKCSICKESAYWFPLAVIHLIQEKKNGVIIGKSYDAQTDTINTSGERFDFLCEASFKGYRESAQSKNQPRHYVSDPAVATCYNCLKVYNQHQHPMGSLIIEGF